MLLVKENVSTGPSSNGRKAGRLLTSHAGAASFGDDHEPAPVLGSARGTGEQSLGRRLRGVRANVHTEP